MNNYSELNELKAKIANGELTPDAPCNGMYDHWTSEAEGRLNGALIKALFQTETLPGNGGDVMGFDEWWAASNLDLHKSPKRVARAAYSAGIDAARRDMAQSLRTWPMDDLIAHCGEMSAQDIQRVRAVLDYVADLAGRMVPL